MGNFTWLQKGDNMPASAVAQLLLNKAGAALTVDGYFGSRTKSAVWQFQDGTPGLSRDGVIGQNTWTALMKYKQLQIVDFVDVTDDAMLSQEVAPLEAIGAKPIYYRSSGVGVNRAVNDIAHRMNDTFLLRMHGHGAPGIAGISDGEHAGGSDHSFGLNWETANQMRKLFGLFGPYGCMQFMHCQTGRGHDGDQFLKWMSEATGVPASAAIRDQFSGTLKKLVRFEGTFRTRYPGGVSLKQWAASLPPM